MATAALRVKDRLYFTGSLPTLLPLIFLSFFFPKKFVFTSLRYVDEVFPNMITERFNLIICFYIFDNVEYNCQLHYLYNLYRSSYIDVDKMIIYFCSKSGI